VGLGIVALLTALMACGSSNSPIGQLYVRVVDKSMVPVADAAVTTEPATQSLTTDALGSVFFAKVPVAGYAVTAMHPTAGSGRGTAQVLVNMVSEVVIVLNGVPGNLGGAGGGGGRGQGGASAGGRIGSTGGAGGSVGAAGGGGRIAGAAGAGGTIGFGGTVGQGGMPASGGGAGGAWSATITLAALTKDSNGVDLTWTPAPATAFATYRIYRGTATTTLAVINILQDGTSTHYRDESPMLGVAYTYRVGGVTAAGQEIQSNTQMITTGISIDVASQVERMMVDPTRPYLYALDKVNNSLHFVNLTTNTVEKTIFVGSTPVDLDINVQGKTLYVANFGSTQIATIDLDSRAMTGAIVVDPNVGTWQGNPYRLACTAGDTLAYTSMDQWNDLKLVNALTGASLGAANQSIYEPDLVASPDGTSVYVGESGISTETLYRFDIVSSKLTLMDQAAGINEFTGASVLMTKDAKYIFYAGRKFLAKNLKSVLGTFSEGIVAINSDGSLAIGATHMFDGATFAATRMTPLSTSTMAVSPDDKTLYLYDSMSSHIYLYQLKK